MSSMADPCLWDCSASSELCLSVFLTKGPCVLQVILINELIPSFNTLFSLYPIPGLTLSPGMQRWIRYTLVTARDFQLSRRNKSFFFFHLLHKPIVNYCVPGTVLEKWCQLFPRELRGWRRQISKPITLPLELE